MPDIDETTLRSREEIAATFDRLKVELEENLALGIRGEAYTRGQLAALGWVLETAELTPLTGRAGADGTDRWALTREQIAATDMLYGRAERDRRGVGYISGVEHALMWVLKQAEGPLYDSPD